MQQAVVKMVIPYQVVFNKFNLNITDLHKELSNIRQLERILVSKRILFKKVTIMPKKQIIQTEGVCM